MNVLLTGATGFIGSHLLADLVSLEANIIVIVRNADKLTKTFRDKVKIIESDLCNYEKINILLDDLRHKSNIDTVVHLAALTDFYAPKNKLVRVNVSSTLNLLDWCVKAGVRKFIFSSTIEAIGPISLKDVPADENIHAGPVSDYGVSKLMAEVKINDFSLKYKEKIKTVVLRLGNVYGPGSGFLIPALARSIRINSELVRLRAFWGNFIYNPIFIDDVVRIISRLALADIKNSGTYNICGSEFVRLEDLYHKVAGVINHELVETKKQFFLEKYLTARKRVFRIFRLCDTITYFTTTDGDRSHRAFSIKKAADDFNFLPEISLEEGIERTLR
jgi:nucleoside-diphosphate-sugar epimerase